MKTKRLLMLLSLVAFMCVSCGKTCRCYRYDGNVDEFDIENLENQGTSCEAQEDINFGLTYSLCERVIF